MASRREVESLKTELKDSSSKEIKRTPKKTKHLDPSFEITASKGRPRSRSRSRSRTPTRKPASRTVTPRVKSSSSAKKADKKSPKTQKSESKSQLKKSATPKSPKTPKTRKTVGTGSASKRKSEANDSSSGVKKIKTLVTDSDRTPSIRRSTRLLPKSSQKVKFTNNKTDATSSGVTDNQNKGWLSYCTLM